jgi:hypothetical protein
MFGRIIEEWPESVPIDTSRPRDALCERQSPPAPWLTLLSGRRAHSRIGWMSDLSAQGHAGPRELRRLLEAVLVVGSELDLATALRRIIEAAADLFTPASARSGCSTRPAMPCPSSSRRHKRSPTGGHRRLPKGTAFWAAHRPSETAAAADLREHPDSFGFPRIIHR